MAQWERKGPVLWAVVRFDRYAVQYVGYPRSLTCVAIVPTQEEADSEVDRLNRVNADKDCEYFSLPGRFFPEGRGVQPS